MLLQFTTGSTDDRQHFGIQIFVLNAGIQPGNVLYRYVRYSGEAGEAISETIIESRAKIPPQEERSILSNTAEKEARHEVILMVDSPTLIITVKAETHHPLFLKVYFVSDITLSVEESLLSPYSLALFCGYLSKGEPF